MGQYNLHLLVVMIIINLNFYITVSAADGTPLYVKESSLVEVLMGNYDSEILPQADPGVALKVDFHATFNKLLDVDEKAGIIYTTFYPRLEWVDERLKWTNNATYPFKQLTMKSEKIWLPDLSIYNSLQSDLDSHLLTPKVIVHNNGRVVYVPHMVLKTPCQAQLVDFPFDTQTCHIYLGSWVLDITQLNLVTFGNEFTHLRNYEENADWKIKNFTVISSVTHYNSSDNGYSKLTMTITMSRRGSFYYRVFIAPAAVALFIIPVIHFVPPSSNEKLTLGGLLLVCTTLLFQMAEQFFPAFSLSNVPLLIHYYTGILVLLFMSLMLSCLSVMIGTGDTKSKRVPRFIRICCIDRLGYIFCAKGRTARYDYELLHLEKALRFSVNREQSRDEQEMEDVNEESDGETPNNVAEENSGKPDEGMKEVLKTLINELQYARYKEQIKSEWAQLAIIVDRLGALIILTLAIIITLVVTMHSR